MRITDGSPPYKNKRKALLLVISRSFSILMKTMHEREKARIEIWHPRKRDGPNNE
jgi:hypothetical protein